MSKVTGRKKILFVVEAMGGGVFTYIVDLVNELSTTYDMYVAYSLRPQTPLNYKDFFNPAVQLIEVKNFTREINLLKDLRAIFEVRRINKMVNPDIIHLHSSKAGVVGRVAFSGKRIPLFYTPHGYSFLMENYKSSKRAFFRIIESLMAKRRCTTISCSKGEHFETLKLTKNALYVNNGINTREIRKITSDIKKTEHPFTVFTIGRICDQKNPKLFNEIAESLLNVRFLWIGDGESREKLKSDNIEITGWIDRAEVFSKIVNADVFLLTSLWEGMPISLLESMYMRKKCVVSDVIGNHDVIQDNVNGRVCRSVEEFKFAITEKLDSSMTEKAFNDIEREFNIEVMSTRYSRIYETVLCGLQVEDRRKS